MSCNHMRYYSDLILFASVWFVRSGQEYVVALCPMVSYFTPTFKGWYSSSSLARRTKWWVLAGKEKRYSSVWDGVFPFLLFFPPPFLFSPPNCWSGCHSSWTDSEPQLFFQVFTIFSWPNTTRYDLSQQILFLQPPWREQVETRIQACVYFFNTMT